MITSLLHAFAAALLLATVMTVGDYVWAAFHIPHRTFYGILHGAVMCLFIGAVIGARAGRILAGASAGPFIGVVAAVAFYVLAPSVGWGALLPAWMVFWSLFSLLQQRLPPVERREPGWHAGLRGLAAAVLSGLAFYAISGIWTRPGPDGPNYAVHFASWCVAFLPGFVALFAGSGRTDRGMRAAALVALTALLVTTPAFARAEQWIEVKSPNVTVVSSAGAGSSRTMAWQLEQVRSAVKTLWPWAKVDLNRPFTVLAVDDEKGMRALAPGFWEKKGGVRPASVWVSAPDHYFLAIRTDLQGEDTPDTNPHASAYFMYVSLILDQSVDVELPEWLSRGLAGVLSNTVVRSSKVLVGAPFPDHLQLLGERTRLKIPALLKVAQPSPELTTNDGLQRFDAEAWAFVHFLMFGKQGGAAGLNQFFKLLANGTDSNTAFLETFGKPESLEDEFVRYRTQRVFTYHQLDVDVAVKREGFAQRALPVSESASIRALLHVAMGRPVEARAAIAEALKAGGTAPEDGTVEGLLLDREQKPDEAAAAFARAVAEGSKSAHVHYRLAGLRWVPGADKEKLQEVEKLLAQATTLNVRHAGAYARLAEVRSVLGNPASLGLALRAVQLEPSEMSHRLVVTRILMRDKRYDDALKAVQAAAPLAKTPEQIAAARELQQAIERAK